ncbi:MAG: hypothetical protein Ct9H300mP29_8800 [Candidatus Neomarinimicrobiota bacterium]|nr:MAG: hypothetical protein Ct9H300mP29_8800 [Candidatus Neomarinimicrobiota bacterium]
MDFVIVQSYAMTELAKSAHIVLPGLAPFEREGPSPMTKAVSNGYVHH